MPVAKVHIQAEDVQDSNYTIIMQLYCTNLEKKDLFGKVSTIIKKFHCSKKINSKYKLSRHFSWHVRLCPNMSAYVWTMSGYWMLLSLCTHVAD